MPLKDPEARRKYHREYMARRFREDPEFKQKHLARVRSRDERNWAGLDVLIAEFKRNGCIKCPEKEPCCLSAHHLRDKKFSIGDIYRQKYSVETVREELKKCVCLCENCHRKVHAGIIELKLASNDGRGVGVGE